MQTRLPQNFLATNVGIEAESILRSCVHCGFCNATCPTYQLTHDELEGPRGRIYLIKTLLEEGAADGHIQQHLDNCLSCKACETTCPSSVNYHRLLDIARPEVEKVKRPLAQKIMRKSLLAVLPYPGRYKWLVQLGRRLRPVLPKLIRSKIPLSRRSWQWSRHDYPRRVLIATGCVQAAAVPSTDAALSQLLDVMGIAVTEVEGCCGAMAQHLGETDRALATAKSNIDRWWPLLEQGVEAIVISASGCAPQLREYVQLLAGDKNYAERAGKLSALIRDPVELLEQYHWQIEKSPRVAFHSPCSLVHGSRLDQRVKKLLKTAGFELVNTANDGVCCGSAGTYSITNPETSQQLLKQKMIDLKLAKPEIIVTANVGCQLHLESAGTAAVLHWVELLAENVPGIGKR